MKLFGEPLPNICSAIPLLRISFQISAFGFYYSKTKTQVTA
jgi:hypothetical protein